MTPALNTDGTVKGDGTAQGMDVAGTYNIPLQTGDLESGNPRGHNLFRAQGCTIHIFWQAPNENRIVASWYGRGVHVAGARLGVGAEQAEHGVQHQPGPGPAGDGRLDRGLQA